MRYNLFVLILFFLAGCSNDPSTSGTFNPNSLKGVVTDPHGSPIKDAEVIVKKTTVTDSGETVLYKRDTKTDKDGTFSFDDIEPGRCFVIAKNDSLVSVMQVTVVDEGNDDIGTMISAKKKTLIGRVFGADKIDAFVAGLGVTCQIDSLGFYVLEDIPPSVTVSFLSQKMINVLPLEIKTEHDTAYVHDMGFTFGGASSVDVEMPYESSLETAYQVTGIIYPEDNIPDWYTGKVFEETGISVSANSAYVFTGTYDSLWNNPLNWYWGKVPSASDSVAVISGVCVADSISNTHVVTLAGNAVFKPSSSSFNTIEAVGGIYFPQGDVLVDDMFVSDTLTYHVPLELSGSLSGVYTGGGVIIKTGLGALMLETESAAFTGECHVAGGYLRGTVLNGLGASSLIVKKSAIYSIQIENALAAFNEVYVEYDSLHYGRIEVSYNSDVSNFTIGTDKLMPGVYSSETDSPVIKQVLQGSGCEITVIE